MKNVLVTGAAGFLGSHLCRHHLDLGHYVLGVDNFCSSTSDSQHLKDLQADDRFELLVADITDTDFSTRRWPEFRPHIIYNFACPASPPIYQSMPVNTMMTCTVGTGNVLALAMRCKSVVVHASTSEVYGDPTITPQHESYRGEVNPYGPRSCYDEGKRAAEALCYDYRNTHGVDARLVRIFNTYGPHMDPHDGRVVSNFICQALLGEKLTVYGDGFQGRSFCYVDDLVKGITALGELQTNPGTPINLGNPEEFTVLSLAQQVLKKVYRGDRLSIATENMITYRQLPKDDPMQRCPDISLARMHLDWEPNVKLGDGLDRTIEYFRQALAREAAARR